MTRLRVGLIGLGEVAQVMHLPALRRLQDRFEVTGLHDISPSVLARIAARWNVAATYASAEDLVAAPDVDAVLVLSPDQHHHGHVAAALVAGKHVLVEKPAALTRNDVADLAARADAAGRVVMVGYMRRYAPAFLAARDRLADLGPITHADLRDYMCEGPWFHRQTTDVIYPAGDIPKEASAASRALRSAMMREICGADASPALLLGYELLTGVASHSISAMRDLFGMPARVAAAHVSAGGNHLVAALDYGDFSVTYQYLVDNLARFDGGFDVYTDTKRLSLAFPTPYVRNLPMTVEIQSVTEAGNETTLLGPFYKDAFVAELEAFHAAVTGGGPVLSSLTDSIDDFRIFEEIVARLRGA
ncbi:Gfo/Idh/MocA family oxidoreductase [Methylobrevis albus]|uniref:Gfo/Idh/MocA family oxidoreductase n=1 Tax=Methylobrevis albus TaxID=2793297 RepID=A0A931MY14_9HYPH|nr:Gfo/Idh/MocA family oxidoreductase [Methylobrevis albus]MBH0239888.1 Gfo/Idh/MocA family oxidoreductase [Methylobrevis albus]